MVTGKREKVKESDEKIIKKSFGIGQIPNDCESGGHEIRTRNPRKGRLISNEVASHSLILLMACKFECILAKTHFSSRGGEGNAISNFQLAISNWSKFSLLPPHS